MTVCHHPTPAVLFRFDPATPFAPWTAIDDPTMGGRSRSALVPTDGGAACFTGVVSLENSGGFCSVRSPDFAPVSGAEVLALRVRGDGKAYKVCLHTRYMQPGTSYRAGFNTRPGEWLEIHLPLTEFVLMRFGARAGVLPVDPARVTAISLLIADRQEGPFALELTYIGLVRTADGGKTT
ncbi:MAG: CIA30 family protein [Fimbriiglobus sp.]|nr:CIA30 family protein [Fimbriiglobus sp.]